MYVSYSVREKKREKDIFIEIERHTKNVILKYSKLAK